MTMSTTMLRTKLPLTHFGKKLKELYERKTANNKAFLIRKLVNLKFKEGTSITEHLSEMQVIVNQLSTMKMVLDDEL